MEYIYLLNATVIQGPTLTPFSGGRFDISLGYFSDSAGIWNAASIFRSEVALTAHKLGARNLPEALVEFHVFRFLINGCNYNADANYTYSEEYKFYDSSLYSDFIAIFGEGEEYISDKIERLYVLQSIWKDDHCCNRYFLGYFISYDEAYKAAKEMSRDYSPRVNAVIMGSKIEDILRHQLVGFKILDVTINNQQLNIEHILTANNEYNLTYSAEELEMFRQDSSYSRDVPVNQFNEADIVEVISQDAIKYGIVERTPIPESVAAVMRESKMNSKELDTYNYYTIIDESGMHLRVKPTDIFWPFNVPDSVQISFADIRLQHDL